MFEVKTKETKKKYNVTCPKCKITYGVDILSNKAVQCMDCGCIYLQKTHSDIVIDWVREKIMTVTGS